MLAVRIAGCQSTIDLQTRGSVAASCHSSRRRSGRMHSHTGDPTQGDEETQQDDVETKCVYKKNLVVTVWWSCGGGILYRFIQSGTTVTADVYSRELHDDGETKNNKLVNAVLLHSTPPSPSRT
ncbi:hypothetical protein EVAR_36340_1 [Eumeta japonica]|uniref:Uncharacterized protein n=1 Tax=Eumeta variegata TaxID=151549 RepID=A0A4C1W5L4_EUMVA|nr:hypothetical protein EVAR_36340_1 [Eumeta japonica]